MKQEKSAEFLKIISGHEWKGPSGLQRAFAPQGHCPGAAEFPDDP
jgi:hypothetical protein